MRHRFRSSSSVCNAPVPAMRIARKFVACPIAFVFAGVLLALGCTQQQSNSASSLPEDPPAIHHDPAVLNPRHYRSPSGKYLLHVDPADRYGRGDAAYRVAKSGEDVWSDRLPFTLHEAGITDDGVVGGYAYTHGSGGFGKAGLGEGPGEFLVVIIDAGGKIRLKESTQREASRFLHTAPNPAAAGLFVDGANDRLVVRVEDPDVNRRVETWRVYRLSTGAEAGRLQPKQLMAHPKPARFVIDAKPVAGSPLTLLHWWRYDGRHVGARFTLVDSAAKPVWSLDLKKDYETAGDRTAADRLRDFIHRQGALLRVDQPGQFELLFAADSKRVTFSVKQGLDKNWVVAEVSRAPFSFVSLKREAPGIPERPLKSLGEIVLQQKQLPVHPIRDLWDFVLDGRGRIAFLRHEQEGAQSFVLVDASGELLHELALDFDDEPDAASSSCTWVGGNRFVITRSEYGVEGKAKAWWLDAETGDMQPIPGFDCPPVESIDGSPDGSFVVLGTMRYQYTMTDMLCGFDPKGKREWTIDEGQPRDADLLFSPEDATVTSSGEVAVVDNIRKSIQFFDRRGKYLRTIDLEQTWGRRPNYLAGIANDVKGQVLVHDFHGTPPFVRLAPDGTVKDGFRPKYADGRGFATRGDVQVSVDGRLWTSDGHALLRLDDAGVVDLVLGDIPQADRLGKIAGLTIDRRGLIYAVDSRTGSVHVFDFDGQPLHVCQTKSTDFSEEPFDPPITVTDDGHVYLGSETLGGSRQDRYLHFSPDGTRLGFIRLKGQQCYVQPGTGNVLALDYDEAYLVDAAGDTIRTIRRNADGNWLQSLERAAVAADGSFAIVAADANSIGTALMTVSIYDVAGEPVQVVELPRFLSSFPRIAYDGRHLVATGDRVVIFDSSGTPLQTFTPASESHDEPWWLPYLVADGRELVLFDAQGMTLQRYALE